MKQLLTKAVDKARGGGDQTTTTAAASPLPDERAVFQSKFSDRQILDQLRDREYNLALAEHNWEALRRRGPCVVSIAEDMVRGGVKTKAQAAAVVAEALRKGARATMTTTTNGAPFSDSSSVSSYVTANSTLTSTTTNYDELSHAMLHGFRRIAESYLDRSPTRKADPAEEEVCIRITSRTPTDNGRRRKSYVATQLLARGSAGLIYAGTDAEEEEGEDRSSSSSTTANPRKRALVLKKIFETQRESAENELVISQRLKSSDACLRYLDSGLDEEGNLWLVLPRMKRTKYGVDLKEYLVKGFFQSPDVPHRTKQLVVIQLLRGLRDASRAGVVFRDVKPDNVLFDPIHSTFYMARWSDFGLAVDINNIRGAYENREGEADVAVLNWWYDTIKLVPRPKWVFRRPPERCFQDPALVPPSSFDMYMFGIICISCALGVDLPHIDDPVVKSALEKALGRVDLNTSPSLSYLKTFDPGQECRTNIAILNGFKHSFGDDFGTELFEEVVKMLDPKPEARPTPGGVLTRLTGKENGEEDGEGRGADGNRVSKGFHEMLCSCTGREGDEGGECRIV